MFANYTSIGPVLQTSEVVECRVGITESVVPPESDRPRRSASCGLEQLYDVPRWVLEEDLLAPRPFDDVVAEHRTGVSKSADLGVDVVDDEVDPVPAAGSRLGAVRIGRPAELAARRAATGGCRASHRRTPAVSSSRPRTRAARVEGNRLSTSSTMYSTSSNSPCSSSTLNHRIAEHAECRQVFVMHDTGRGDDLPRVPSTGDVADDLPLPREAAACLAGWTRVRGVGWAARR